MSCGLSRTAILTFCNKIALPVTVAIEIQLRTPNVMLALPPDDVLPLIARSVTELFGQALERT